MRKNASSGHASARSLAVASPGKPGHSWTISPACTSCLQRHSNTLCRLNSLSKQDLLFSVVDTVLLEVASLESLGHSVSLVCARNASIGMFRCSVGFSCFEGHYQLSLLEVQNTLPPNGLPRQYSCSPVSCPRSQMNKQRSCSISQ